ncbi:hypothetical protein HanPI659440_Chr04g0177701 [Helianthus annuus]|nr:hypothetical protein HanPI659440_Chr04g0177701 [Helianthus annuus]
MGPMDRYSLEQRYINSVNGIIVNPILMYNRNFRLPTVNTSQTSFTISSACSSPRTPSENDIPTVAANVTSPELGGFRKGLMTNQQFRYHRQPPPPYHYLLQPYPKPPLNPNPRKNSGPDHFMRVRPTNHSPNSCLSAHLGYQKGSPYDEYHAYNRYDRESVGYRPQLYTPTTHTQTLTVCEICGMQKIERSFCVRLEIWGSLFNKTNRL